MLCISERLLAQQNPLSQADRPHQLFADAPPPPAAPASGVTSSLQPPPPPPSGPSGPGMPPPPGPGKIILSIDYKLTVKACSHWAIATIFSETGQNAYSAIVFWIILASYIIKLQSLTWVQNPIICDIAIANVSWNRPEV